MARRGISDWPFGFDPNEFQFAPPGNFGSGSANSVGRSSDPTLTIGFPPVPIIGPEWPQAQSDQTQQSDPIPIGTSSAAGLTIRLVYDAAALAAPASFRAGIQQAADILMAAFSDPITINLTIDYSGTGGGASAGPNHGLFVSYSTVRTDLINNASPGDHTFDSLTTSSSIQGQSQVAVWDAQLKLFGLLGPNDTTTDDGGARFSTDINLNLLVGVALHELTHAMGRIPYGPQPDIFDLFRFTSADTRLFQGGATAPAAYFSLDGGNTKLADYGRTSDASDFLNSGVQGPNDSFNEFYSSGTLQQLTAIDLKQMAALGYHLNAGTPGSIAISDVSISEGNGGTKIAIFTVTRAGGTAAFDVNFATANNSATVADGDYLASSGTLHFAANATTQTVSITINGDTKFESDETFFVNLSNATNGASIIDSQAVGTITNDDINYPPVVTAHNVSVGLNQSIAAYSMFSVSDQDGGSITQYGFYDYGGGGGHFALNGQTLAAGQWSYINAASLSAVTYVGGTAAGSENLVVAAYDGFNWSSDNANWLVTGTLTATTQPNHAPVVTAHNVSVGVNQPIAASSMFGVTDQDGDSIAQYGFYDYSGAGGHFALNGQTLAAGQWNYVSAANLGAVTYVGGAAAGSETLVVAANDGHEWSSANANWLTTGSLTATTTQANHAPVVTAHNVSMSVNQSIAASSMFGVTDQDNDSIAQYAFYDYSGAGGHFALNGQTLAAGQWNYINAASLSAVSYVGGSSPGSETLVVAAYDGHDWSAANPDWLQTGSLTATWLI